MNQEQRLFHSQFMEMVKEDAEQNGTSIESELTNSIIAYVVESGEAVAPEICECASNPTTEKFTGRYKLSAYDYSEVTGILDLFGTIYYEGQSPSLAESTAMRMASDLGMLFNVAVDGKEAKAYRQTNPEVADVLEMIREQYNMKKIELIRIFVLSNGFASDELELTDGELGSSQKVTTEYHFWDMEAIRKAEMARANNQEILINFAEEFQKPLDCIEVHDDVNNITTYLTIMPAYMLARIYKQYKVRLIDQNVRNFLGGKVKPNKSMADTLCTTPERFFSFNNGLSSTCANVETAEIDGRKYITSIRNWHIVNGGQTTTTIYNAVKNKKITDEQLQKAFVAVKISVIPQIVANEKPELISDIAQFANSQNKVKDSDLSANSKFMRDLETQSRKEWTAEEKPTLWYFERLRGQFNTEKSIAGGPKTHKAQQFEDERPANRRLNKTDIAKLEMAWAGKPFMSCKGGEVCYDKFWDSIKDQSIEVDSKYFHNIVAKMIIYKTTERMMYNNGNKGYAAIICCYVLALISIRSQGKVDLNYIWHNQSVQEELKDTILTISKVVLEQLQAIGGAGDKNPQTESKKVEFWNSIQNKTLGLTLPDSVLISEEEHFTITVGQQAEIDNAMTWGLDNWQNLAKWARKDGRSILSIMEKKKLDHMVAALDRGDAIQPRLAVDCMKVKRVAVDSGFSERLIY